VKPDIGSESRFLPTPPAFDAPVRGGGGGGSGGDSRRNIAIPFGNEKLEWLGYHAHGEKILNYVYSF